MQFGVVRSSLVQFGVVRSSLVQFGVVQGSSGSLEQSGAVRRGSG